jgi:hypothetical protein
LVKRVARTILDLSTSGIQIFIATHSLFLLRELEILSRDNNNRLRPQYFGLQKGEAGVEVLQGSTVDDIGNIASLEEDLEQSDRFLEAQ